jgi:hypothetical protein
LVWSISTRTSFPGMRAEQLVCLPVEQARVLGARSRSHARKACFLRLTRSQDDDAREDLCVLAVEACVADRHERVAAAATAEPRIWGFDPAQQRAESSTEARRFAPGAERATRER